MTPDRARFDPAAGTWCCFACGETLAIDVTPLGGIYTAGNTAHLRSELVPLPKRYTLPNGGEIARFGLPSRVMAGRHGARTLPQADRFVGPVDTPVYAYCVRTGICGRGQIIEA